MRLTLFHSLLFSMAHIFCAAMPTASAPTGFKIHKLIGNFFCNKMQIPKPPKTTFQHHKGDMWVVLVISNSICMDVR